MMVIGLFGLAGLEVCMIEEFSSWLPARDLVSLGWWGCLGVAVPSGIVIIRWGVWWLVVSR